MKKNLTYLLVTCLLSTFSIAGTPQQLEKNRILSSDVINSGDIKNKFNKESETLAFTENKGQIRDQNNLNRKDILYSGFNGQLAYHFKKNGFSYQQYRVDSKKNFWDHKTKTAQEIPATQTIYRSDFEWLACNENVIIRGQKSNNIINNYHLEEDLVINDVHHYEELVYHNLYEGIDVKWYHKEGQLKYDYLVSAGADYKQIKLKVSGLSSLSINSKGELVMQTPLGKIIEQAPFVQQAGKTLHSKWKLKNNIISLEIDNIDSSLPFIIDPIVRLWGTYYGGNNNEYCYSCTTDASGNVYLSGMSGASGTIIVTSGAYQTATPSFLNAFLVKFNSSGVRQWGTYFGGAGAEVPYSLNYDNSGNIYMVGAAQSPTGVASVGAHQTVHGGGTYDAFIAKFTTGGAFVWATYYGGNNDDRANSCAIDGSGNVFIAGYSVSSDANVIGTPGSYGPTYVGPAAFFAKFNSSGVRQWGSFYPGCNEFFGCAVDGSGNLFLAGVANFSYTGATTGGSHQQTFGASPGNNNGLLAKFDGSGSRLWATYYGGDADDNFYNCATDPTGNVYVTGSANTSTGNVIATVGSFQSVKGSFSDVMLVKFNGSGVRQWGTYYGGGGYDIGKSIVTDASSNVYIAGQTDNYSGFVSSGSFVPPTIGGSMDAFIAKFDASGNRIWGTAYGGSDLDYGKSCAYDGAGNVYMCGVTRSSAGLSTMGAHQQAYSGGAGIDDGFLVSYRDCAFGTPTITPVSPVCEGDNLNLASSVTSSIAVNYSWTGPNAFTSAAQNPTIVGISLAGMGNYTLTVSDGLGCYQSASVSVVVNTSPTISVASGSICPGDTYIISPSGANTYTVSGGSFAVSPVTNSNYTITGTSFFGCPASNTVICTVTVAANPTINVSATSTLLCGGNSATLTASGASTYTWSGGPLTASYVVSPTVNTTYTVEATSALGCTNTAVKSVSIISSPTLTISPSNTLICSGASATLTASGAASYTWSAGPITASYAVNPTVTTIYTVTGTAANTCTNSAVQTISVNATPNLTITPSSTVICYGKSATITAGGAGSYTWSGGPSTASYVVSPTITTSYTVTGGSSGCTNTAVQSISVITTPTVSISTTGTILCSGLTTTLTGNGANSYVWTAGPSTADYAVTPGSTSNYTVIGTAVNGCTASAVQQVSVNASPVITITPSSTVICSGKSATLNASGANTYTWTSGPLTSSYVVSPMATSIYTVIGTTAVSGCTDMAVVSISVNSTPTISISPSSTVLCLGKTAILTGLGGNTYVWSGGPTTATYAVSPTVTTIYTVTGTTAASGCTNTAVQSISVNALTAISISPAAPVICSGLTSTLTASGVTTYTWMSGPLTPSYAVSPGVTTIYTVTGTDAATGCTNTAFATVSVNTTPTLSVNSGSICSGNSFTIVPSGASTYTISGGTATVSPMTTSSYTVTGTSAAGCAAINTVVSTVSVYITPTVAVNSGSICTGNSFTMLPSGAATYTYSSGTNIVSPLTSTAYSVTGSSTAGCISANTAISNVTVNITPTVAVNSGTLCTGLVFTMVPSGASTYTFSNGSNTVNPIVNTSYSVTGTSAAGCIATNTAVSSISVFVTPTVSANSGSICTGNNFTIVPSGASTYTISGSGSFIVSPTAYTSYSIIGTSTAGCVSANTATSGVTAYTTPTITIVPTPANAIICTGQYAWMAANGASTYTWVSGPASQAYTVNPMTTTSYTVIGTSGSSGCTNTAVQNLTVNVTPTLSIVPSGTLICSGNSSTLSASGTSSFTWAPGSSTLSNVVFSPTATTMYTVIGTAANNCTAMAMQSVSVNITPTISINPSHTVICSGNTATFTAGGASTYLWNTAATGSNIVINPSVTTTYSVIGTTSGCTNTAVRTLSVNLTPTITITPSQTVLCSGKSTTLLAGGAGTYTWSTSSLSSSISVSPSVTTNYTLNGTASGNNCTNTAVQTISVNLTPTVSISPSSTVICTGKTATYTALGADTYSWSSFTTGSVITLSPSTTTGYTVTGTNSASGCTNTASQSLSVNTTPSISLVQTSTVICSGKSVTITLSGANSYSWNTGANFSTIIFNPTVTTNYSVVGYATNNCTNSAATSISVNTTPTVSVNSGTICAGEIFTISPSGASTYTISGGSATVSPVTNSVYLVSGTSTNGCIATNTPAANVFVNALPSISVNSGSICIGNSFTLLANGASTYTWDSGANTSSLVVSPVVPTVYTVTGSNINNCIKTITTSVVALVIPNVSISGNTAVCIGSSMTLTANGATNFTWSPGAQTNSVIVVSPTVNTTYSVRGVLGSNSCSNTASQLITINPKPILSISGNSFVCPGNPLLLTANGASTYTWTGGVVSNTLNVTPTVSTTYSVSGTDANGCSNSSNFLVKTASMITPSLCLVTVDSLSINNEIYWDKTLFPRADTFLVYREYIATQYKVIARIPRSAYSAYVDTNRSIGPNIGNPNHSSYKYKLQYKDSCGNLSAMSPYHKTIKLDDYQTGNFSWNYYNIDGVDYQLANYYLWRYHVITGSLTLLGGTSGNSFTDPLYASLAVGGNMKWYVTTSGFVCNPSLKSMGAAAAGKTGTKSNNSNERQFPTPEGVNETILAESGFVIYPNPAKERFVLNADLIEDYEVELTDVLGRTISVPMVREKTSTVFEIGELKQGLYLVRITRGKEQLVKKVVVE